MMTVGPMLFCAGSAKAGEYADSLPKPVPEYHYTAAAVAAAVTLPIEQKRVSVNLAPDRAVLVYKF